jgi:hypothetical protein
MFIANECFNNIWRDENLSPDGPTPFELQGWNVVDATLRDAGMAQHRVLAENEVDKYFELRADLDSIWFGH